MMSKTLTFNIPNQTAGKSKEFTVSEVVYLTKWDSKRYCIGLVTK